MRRNSGLKKILIIYGGMLLVLIIACVTVYIVYNNKIKESAKQSLLAAEKINEIVPNNSILEEASTELSKSINQYRKESIVLINQITTISKQRIFYDVVLKNVRIANESLDLIDKQIIKFFTK